MFSLNTALGELECPFRRSKKRLVKRSVLRQRALQPNRISERSLVGWTTLTTTLGKNCRRKPKSGSTKPSALSSGKSPFLHLWTTMRKRKRTKSPVGNEGNRPNRPAVLRTMRKRTTRTTMRKRTTRTTMRKRKRTKSPVGNEGNRPAVLRTMRKRTTRTTMRKRTTRTTMRKRKRTKSPVGNEGNRPAVLRTKRTKRTKTRTKSPVRDGESVSLASLRRSG